MRASVWGQIRMPATWLALLGLVITLSPPSSASTARLLRRKRHWEWNTRFVEEERRNPPHNIGKLSSNRSNNFTIFKIKGEGANTIFTVNELGDILVHKTLDRETKSIYKLTAQLIDIRTRQVVENEGEFKIIITDINDNSPVFPNSYKGSVDERSPQGTKVLAATATDRDDPTTVNGQLEYKLLNGTELFRIDSNGIITTKVNYLDHEKQNKYVIVVHAKDMPGFNAGNTASTTVTIIVGDINDNLAIFKTRHFSFDVKEDEKKNYKIGTMEVEDKDEEQNKNPVFKLSSHHDVFKIEKNLRKDGVLSLIKELDYETKNEYSFNVDVTEEMHGPEVDNEAERENTRAKVIINVIDVDEPPVFSKQSYNFSVYEKEINVKVGRVSATDPDKAKLNIWYHIDDPNCPVNINRDTGEMTVVKELDREEIELHEFYVTAGEATPKGLKSRVMVKLQVLDINDNEPALTGFENAAVCEADRPGTIVATLSASDKDVQKAKFSFALAKPNSNFSLVDNKDNTANITVLQGGFNEDDPSYVLEVMVSDNGKPNLTSITKVSLGVCRCSANRETYSCKATLIATGTGYHALIAIILCIIFILIVVILFVLRRRYQKDTLVTGGKNLGEIHEQLVSYDEEGGGEMDTNGYDVSVLTSAWNDGSLLPSPGVYTVSKHPPAARGDMAAMIEVKKDEADHDRDGVPYDTLHVYGYEGTESLAGSLSSLETSSDDSNLDYNFLNDWGPRFKTLAELYGVDGSEDCPY